MQADLRPWHYVVGAGLCLFICFVLFLVLGRDKEVLPPVSPEIGIQTPGWLSEEEKQEAEMNKAMMERMKETREQAPGTASPH